MSLRETVQGYLYRLIHDEERGVTAALLLVVLKLLSQVYGAAISPKTVPL